MIKKDNKTSTSTLSLGSLYDVNKNLIENYGKEITSEEIIQKKEEIINFVKNTKGQYYMLLCNDRKDYTVFNVLNKNNLTEMANVLVDECLINRGVIKGIDLTQTKDAIEIWLSIGKESYCYYFFNYDNGIIEI